MSHDNILEGLREARAAIAEFNASASRGPEHSALIAKLDGLIADLSKPNPDDQGFFWWLLAVGFAVEAVQEGVDFTDARARRLIEHQFSLCHGSWIKAKVIGRPNNEAVAKAQGYRSMDAYIKDRD